MQEVRPGQLGVAISGFVGSVGGDLVGGNKGLNEEQLVAVLAARGLLQPAENAGLQRWVIINLAARLRSSGEPLDFEQAVTELERAVEIALDVIRRGQRGSNEGDFVRAVLAEVANKTKSDDLEGAVQALDDAFAELDRQEAEQRQATQRKRVVFLEAAVAQHTLRRDAQAVAVQIERLVALEQPTDRPAWLPAFRQRLNAFQEEGETEGINFSLLVAIELSRRMASTAGNREEHWVTAVLLGNALQALGERESGTARLEQAVKAYQAALLEWTRDRVPLDWASAQNNLGNAGARGTRDRHHPGASGLAVVPL